MTALPSTAPFPGILLVASPDDFLLELERRAAEQAWRAANPLGEVVAFAQPPSPGRLVQELASPSLFAADRLLVVPDASSYLAAGRRAESGELGSALAALPLAGVALLLAAVSDAEPKGALADAIKGRGEVRFLALPEAPKPWDEGRVSRAQRATLASLVARAAPARAGNDEVVDALCEVDGFRPRELAQAAERLALAGGDTAAAVRAQAGAGERQLRELEDALQQRDAARFARFAGALDAGATLTDWRGDAVAPDGYGKVLGATVGRLLRQALAVRAHAARAGVADELNPKKCAGKDWYPRAFKPRIHAPLSKDIEATPDSPLAGMTPWQLHRAFRLAAPYRDGELIAALGALAGAQVERARGPAVLSAVSSVVLTLMAKRPA